VPERRAARSDRRYGWGAVERRDYAKPRYDGIADWYDENLAVPLTGAIADA
jgi:hypothetical protein